MLTRTRWLDDEKGGEEIQCAQKGAIHVYTSGSGVWEVLKVCRSSKCDWHSNVASSMTFCKLKLRRSGHQTNTVL